MPSWLISTGIAASAFLLLDLAWLSLMAQRLYRPQIGDLLAPFIRLPPALAFYVVYLLVLSLLVVQPALKGGSASQALWNGALLGLASYATYNFTNLATLTRWPMPVVLLDTIWGVVVTGASAWLAVKLTQVIGAS